jgi:hypothetical protein
MVDNPCQIATAADLIALGEMADDDLNHFCTETHKMPGWTERRCVGGSDAPLPIDANDGFSRTCLHLEIPLRTSIGSRAPSRLPSSSLVCSASGEACPMGPLRFIPHGADTERSALHGIAKPAIASCFVLHEVIC